MQIKLENNNYEDTLNLQRKYPTVVIDDFFQNPDIIRKYALSLTYEKAVDGRWPLCAYTGRISVGSPITQ